MLLKSRDFCSMLDIPSGGQRSWVEGAQVPAQIYSKIIWVDIAKYFSGDEVTWIDNLAARDVTGSVSKKMRHADRWNRDAKCIATMQKFSDLNVGKFKHLFPPVGDPPAHNVPREHTLGKNSIAIL